MKQQVSEIGIIGLGKFGFQFGQTLVELGKKVIGVDSNPENVKRAQHVIPFVYQADAIDKETLQQLGFGDLSHVLVSVGDSVSASSMISMYLKELGVPQVWVKATNLDHQKLLLKIGVNEVFIPEHLAARQLANRVAMPGFISELPFAQDMSIKELVVKGWSGQTLRHIDLTNRFNVQVISLKKVGDRKFSFIPKADLLLQEGDTLMVIGYNVALAKLEP
ncbi:MAG: TrkA family potassium uptake protein [Deltaproteobacteria bacterium]|nr:TrkA family potassium uptake protein [Deltaproteobacteria bacterium]